ncbi:hypothetical protein ACFVFQ_00835 [Streptomyces sp. NPDC057743]|uniref:hypothetical protein n=1 Tax=Streptomyces sp. NPDC057743 TaxID=3346236 RepID=UPI00369DEB48
MSVLSVIHIRPLRSPAAPTTPTVPSAPAVRTVLGGVVERLARGAVDSPVLRVLEPPTVRRPSGDRARRRPRAHWRSVVGPDGRRRLEADWRPEV